MVTRWFTRSSSFRTAAPFYLALLLLVVSLFISLAGLRQFYKVFHKAKEIEFDRRLISIGKAAEPGISSVAELTMVSLLQSEIDHDLPQGEAAWKRFFDVQADLDPNYPKIAEHLRNLMKEAHLSEVLLISPQKRLITDAAGDIQPGTIPKLVDLDRNAWEPAKQGTPDSMPYYEYNGVPYKRVYIPIMIRHPQESTGKVGAILRLGASLEAHREIGELRKEAYLLAGVTTVLLTSVALVFYRLMRLFARIEASASHRDRLEAMGALAAGIAHEIRNPLGIIRTLAEGVSGDLEQTHPAREMLTDIIGEVERLNKLVTQYLMFARPDSAESGEEAQPAEVIRAVTTLLSKGDNDTHPIVAEISPAVPSVPMNTSALRQILLNLVLNARAASSAGKQVKIKCQALRGGAQVEIVVSDEGCGMTSREQRRAFDPFYTTKSQGSGLGLPICRHLVTECRGSITLSSRPNEGTTVRVVLPAVKEAQVGTVN
jgi:signal transduction histidine kinase